MRTILKGYIFPLVILMLPSLSANAASGQFDDNLPLPLIEAVSIDELEKERGREGIDITALNNMNLQATLNGNAANNNVTGMNIIDHGAFTNAGGMFSIVQNTGNNVIIQDSTIVNVTIVP